MPPVPEGSLGGAAVDSALTGAATTTAAAAAAAAAPLLPAVRLSAMDAGRTDGSSMTGARVLRLCRRSIWPPMLWRRLGLPFVGLPVRGLALVGLVLEGLSFEGLSGGCPVATCCRLPPGAPRTGLAGPAHVTAECVVSTAVANQDTCDVWDTEHEFA